MYKSWTGEINFADIYERILRIQYEHEYVVKNINSNDINQRINNNIFLNFKLNGLNFF